MCSARARADARKQRLLAELSRHPFRAAWWLRGRHLQTIYSSLLRCPPRIATRLERWPTPDGDELTVYLTAPRPGRPLLLVTHGLEGSAASPYVRGLLAGAVRLGWNAAVFEHRSCTAGGRRTIERDLNRARRLYHLGATDDLAAVVAGAVERELAAHIYIAGVSLGGNVIAKWLGENPAAVPSAVRGAAAVSAPFDLPRSGPCLDTAGHGLYARYFLRTLIPKALAKERQFPGCLDPEAVRRCRTFEAFDTHATAALHGFRDAHDYWTRSSCGPHLQRIDRPTLLLSSADDPFHAPDSLPRELAARSPYLVPQWTAHGGHAGFVAGRAPWRARYWAEEQTLRFFALCEKEEATTPA